MCIKLEMSFILLNIERLCNNETILFSYIDFNDPQHHITYSLTPKQTVLYHLLILYKRICKYSNSALHTEGLSALNGHLLYYVM